MSEGLPPDPRWEGYTLAQKYEWFQAQPGAGVTAPSAASLGGLGAGVAQSGEVLQNAMATTGVNWQGQAADATGDALARAARWATSNGQLGGTGSAAVDGYGSSWTNTKNQIAKPVPEGPEAWWDHVSSLFGVQSDYAKNVAANQAANQAADDALNIHYTHTHSALATFDGPSAVPPLLDGGNPTPTAPPGGNQHTGPASTAGAAGPSGGARAGSEVAPPLGGHAGAATEATGLAGGSGGDTTTPADFTPLTPPATSGATTPPTGAPLTGGAGSAAAQGGAMGSGALGGLAAGWGAGVGMAEPPPRAGFVPSRVEGGVARVSSGAGGAARVLAGRGGPLPPAEANARMAPAGGEPAGATPPAGAGVGGPRAMGEGAAARGDTERTHHNHTFIPTDEPFVTPLDADVTPAVIGPDADGWIQL